MRIVVGFCQTSKNFKTEELTRIQKSTNKHSWFCVTISIHFPVFRLIQTQTIHTFINTQHTYTETQAVREREITPNRLYLTEAKQGISWTECILNLQKNLNRTVYTFLNYCFTLRIYNANEAQTCFDVCKILCTHWFIIKLCSTAEVAVQESEIR